MEYGNDVLYNDFNPIAGWIAQACDPCEAVRVVALSKLLATHENHRMEMKRQGKDDPSSKIELWRPIVTHSWPPGEQKVADELSRMGDARSLRSLEVREANIKEWRRHKGFGNGPWIQYPEITSEIIATQARWMQLNWPVHRGLGNLCPQDCFCEACLENGLTDRQVLILRRRTSPHASVEDIKLNIATRRELFLYCSEVVRNLARRFHMDNCVQKQIRARLDKELEWVQSDKVRLSANTKDFEQRKLDFERFFEITSKVTPEEMKMDKRDTEARLKMREAFIHQYVVKAIDVSTGTHVLGKIDDTIKSCFLDSGDDPDWVYIKDTWYRSTEVQFATDSERDAYKSTEFESAGINDDHLSSEVHSNKTWPIPRESQSEGDLNSQFVFVENDNKHGHSYVLHSESSTPTPIIHLKRSNQSIITESVASKKSRINGVG